MLINPIFQDNAILQAKAPFRIFGHAYGKVTVAVGSEVLSTNANGDWLLTFSPRQYADVTDITVQCENEEITIRNVTFGDVYLLCGQSNMYYSLGGATEDGEIYECDSIRLYSTDPTEKSTRFKSADGWVPCNADTASKFPALGYFIARELQQFINKPVGLVIAAQGASYIQSWLPQSVLD